MTLTPRRARFTAVLRPSPRLPPVMIAALSFVVPTVSFTIGAPLLFAQAQSCILYRVMLGHVFYRIHVATGANRLRGWSVLVRNRSLVQGRQLSPAASAAIPTFPQLAC